VGYDKIREQRFEKQKELGLWPSNMTLPTRLPGAQQWNGLDLKTQAIDSRILAAHAAMIENMDHNVGKVVSLLKSLGMYDNTLIIFTSDNGGSEPFPASNLAIPGITLEQSNTFAAKFNNSVSNIGNANSLVNYADWGAIASVSPFSYFKATMGEGGTRVPFVIKEPLGSSNQEHPNIINAFVHVTDITPTLLNYAGIQPSGTIYKGHSVHPITGKSIKPILDGKLSKIYADNEPVSQEMFNNIAVFMGSWKAEKLFGPHLSDGKWHLYNIKTDIGETTDVASNHPEIFHKMLSDYAKFAKDVGVIVPSGVGTAALQKFAMASD